MDYQHGNSFDMSILLVSLLRGAGYNAYCVSGYATKKLTTMDDTRLIADPVLILEHYKITKNDIDFEILRNQKKEVLATNKKYKVKENKELASQFLKKQQEKKEQIELDANQALANELEILQKVKYSIFYLFKQKR